MRRFAALYSERPRSLRRALNMNAKYAGDQPDTASSARQRAVQCAYLLGVMFACPPEAPFQGDGGSNRARKRRADVVKKRRCVALGCTIS